MGDDDLATFDAVLAPAMEVAETSFGMYYASIRKADADTESSHVRLTAYVLPSMVFAGGRTDDSEQNCLIAVPRDEGHTTLFMIFWDNDLPLAHEPHRTEILRLFGADDATTYDFGISPAGAMRPDRPCRANNWHQDRDAMSAGKTFSGLPNFIPEDQAISSSIGSTFDRDNEHLVGADIGVVKLRRILASAARAEAEGRRPPTPTELGAVRGRDARMSEPWRTLVADNLARFAPS
jgi:hypothetical protein